MDEVHQGSLGKRQAGKMKQNNLGEDNPDLAPFAEMSGGKLYHADARDFLKGIPSNSADLVFLDPPFNLGKKYGSSHAQGDRLEEEDYRQFISEIIGESSRILSEGGSLYLYHIPKWAIEFAPVLAMTLTFRHWIAVSMKNGFVRGRRLYPAHYALLHFSKGEMGSFSRPKIAPAICSRCKKNLRDYGGYAKFVEDGVNLSDVWFDVSPLRHKKYKNRDTNELPPEIPGRVVEISGLKSGVFVDPFAGSGTALVAARRAGMKYLGGDSHLEYCNLIVKRISEEVGDFVVTPGSATH